jgi:glycosyltransferase involved in cell wall biosynthesis
MRVAFTLFGGKEWTGGRNYLVNLIRSLVTYCPGTVTPVLFCGNDVVDGDTDPFERLPGLEIVHSAAFDRRRSLVSLARAIALGVDGPVEKVLIEQDIDAVFEVAKFYGRNLRMPAIAWLPDFQHRHLPHLFSHAAQLKRELGFRAQISAGRTMMLSSEDARLDCERFYPMTRGRTHAVRFAVPPVQRLDLEAARVIADGYGLPANFFYMPNQFWVHKNHQVVIEAIAILKKLNCEVVVVASGSTRDPRDPQHYKRLMDRVEALGIKDNFKSLGLIPYPHLGALMQASAAVINPSLFEGWSTTVEEARALGTPLILSDLSVHQEQAGEAAIYFQRTSAESLARVLGSFQLLSWQDRTRLQDEAAHEAVRRQREFAEQFVTVVNQCVSGGKA